MSNTKKLCTTLMMILLVGFTACQKPKETIVLYPENEIPVSTSSDEAMQEFVDGLKLLDQENAIEARTYFDKALALDPNFVSAQLHKVSTSNSAKDFAVNRDNLLAMRDKANEGEKIMMDLFLADMEDDDVKEMELSNLLVKTYPSSARAYDILANNHMSFDAVEKARANWEKALSLNSDYIPALTSLGNSYMFITPKDTKKAEKYMANVVEKNPESSRAHINLGDCYRADNNLEKALKSYEKAAVLNPKDQVAFSKAGHANSFLGNYDAARSNFKESRAVSQFGNNAFDFEAFTHLYEGDYKKALAFLQEAVKKIDQMNIPASNKTGSKMNYLFDSATIAMHHGETEQLKEIVRLMKPLSNQIGKDVGSNASYLNQKANMLYWDAIVSASDGNFEDAVKNAEMIKTMVQPLNDPNKLRRYHRAHAFLNYKQNKYDEALEHTSKLDPDNIYDKYWMAHVNKMAGNTDIAMNMFKEIENYNFNWVGYALTRNEVKETLASVK